MLKSRKGSRRSFTVETKGGGRGRVMIPSRAAESAPAKPVVAWPPLVEPKAPAAEPRRILPNLIAPELVEIEAPKPRQRGRPRKASAMATEPVAAPVAPVEPAPALKPVATLPAAARRLVRSAPALPPGERWKRRLPRWSR